jgi:hypothetical protein
VKKYLLFAFLLVPCKAMALSYSAGGNSTGGQLIGRGTATNDSAATGFVGEYISSSTANATPLASTTTFGNLVSITLTAGDWDVTAMGNVTNNGAAVTGIEGAISSSSGNTTTDHVDGNNVVDGALSTSVAEGGISIPNFRVQLTSSTVYYFKIKGTFITAVPTAKGRISARRMR